MDQKVDFSALLSSADRDYVVRNNGEKVTVQSLLSDKETIFGLYFSAHWCGPCRSFTPQLIKLYNELKEAGKKFEVIFFSFDRDPGSFDEYFKEMPWLAIPFSDRTTARSAAEAFGVQGIPALTLIDADGWAFDTDGRDTVSSKGVAGYPYKPSDEVVKKMEEERKRLDEEMSQKPKTFTDHRHPHALELVPSIGKGRYECDACEESGTRWGYTCSTCGVSIHPGCVESSKGSTKVDLLGLLTSESRKHVIRNNKEQVAVEQLLQDKDCIFGLYFSAHWCPPCRGFTPKLASIYNEFKAAGKKFEVVFFSSDRTQSDFDEYFHEMPWLAVPFEDRDAKANASKKFKVTGIPTLVLLDADGAILDLEGVQTMVENSTGYPWKLDTAAAAAAEEEKKRVTQEMLSKPQKVHDHRHKQHDLVLVYSKNFGCDGCRQRGSGWRYRCSACDFDMHVGCVQSERAKHVVDLRKLLTGTDRTHVIKNDGQQVNVDELLADKETIIGLYFSAHWCPPCRGFTPQLAQVYETLKSTGKKFEVIFFSSDHDQSAFDEYHKSMPWLAVPFADRAAKEAASNAFNVQGIPTFVILDATGDVLDMQGRATIMSQGAAGYPFK